MSGPAVQPDRLAGARIDLPPEFGGDDHPVTNRGEGLAHQLFVGERTVYFGGVEERDPAVEGRADQGDPGLLFDGRAVPVAQAHAAEPEGRHFEVALTEFTLVHFALPSP